MKVDLDFNCLPTDDVFDERPILIGLNQELESRLRPFPNVLNRARSAVQFAETASRNKEDWMVEADLRAALSDFCGIEEMIKTDSQEKINFTIDRSKNPLIHLLELMRHLNVHVKSVSTKPHKIQAVFADIDTILDKKVICYLNLEDFTSLRNGQRYQASDLKEMLNWFDVKQMCWGAGYVIRVGTEALIEEICEFYSL